MKHIQKYHPFRKRLKQAAKRYLGVRHRTRGEKSYYVITQSPLNQLPMILGAAAAFILTFWISAIFPWATQEISFGFFSAHIPFLGIVPVLFCVHILRTILNAKLVLYEDSINYIEGLAAWHQRSIRMQYTDLKELEIDQTILQKILGVGDLYLTVLATSIESQVKMNGVWNPQKLKEIIQFYIHKARETEVIEEEKERETLHRLKKIRRQTTFPLHRLQTG